MISTFKARFGMLLRWSGMVFLALFCFRLLYGYLATDTAQASDDGANFFSSLENVRKNYASEKSMKLSGDVPAQSAMASSQKFEKTASVKLKTSSFEDDEKRVKAQTKAYNAVIQYEQNEGQRGNREIHLLIGVDPAQFDKFCLEVQKIGSLKAISVTKVDKTNEFRKLNAEKISVEKSLQSLNELKSKGGEIADFVTLNDKILEMETKLQDLGVELGNFDTENEFCTVRLSVYEGATEKNISVVHRIKVALEWTIEYFALLVFALIGLCVLALLLLMIADKLKLMAVLTTRNN
ncbi:DUF4349 domain-containing protein [Fibrella aquatilis]|uniref:DUF4349 domain-containing protein n=1 Tax=Fibrella aquatilis TaxID=2817059 RepID=A0A939JY90_9BACT|nr:DUF4349 domain-containing protein [Fibrella aquatilis]MBO0931839.1 DUF4349 domain-containing protein [Fibrella aquatilis]